MCYLEIKIVFIFIFWELVFVEFLFEYEKKMVIKEGEVKMLIILLDYWRRNFDKSMK